MPPGRDSLTTVAAIDPAPASYRPDGFSRALAWVSGLSGHGWWTFPLFLGVLLAWSHGILWATGLLPFGTIHPVLAVSTFYAPYVLLAISYINRFSERALDAFWPATGWPESDKAAWRREFTTSPGGYGLPTFVIGLLVAIAGFVTIAPEALLPGATALSGNERLIVFAAYLPLALLGYWLVLLAIVHTTRQLRLVARIHREATAIDPFDRTPIYAFSGLTFRTGLAFVLSGYYALVVNGALEAGNVAVVLAISAVFALGIACFVLPLLGIHDRLVRAKDGLMREVDGRLGSLGAEMYRRVDAGQFDGTKVISESIAGVATLRDRIARLPTWPWPPNLLRGFLSALLLPVLVYVASRLIGGQVGV